MIEEAKGDHQKMWKAVNEVCNRNSTLENVQCIISDGIQHTTPKSIASALNSFFASIGRRLADKIRTTWSNRNLVLQSIYVTRDRVILKFEARVQIYVEVLNIGCKIQNSGGNVVSFTKINSCEISF